VTEVITASAPSWTAPFTGPNPRRLDITAALVEDALGEQLLALLFQLQAARTAAVATNAGTGTLPPGGTSSTACPDSRSTASADAACSLRTPHFPAPR